jgi:hypothetical protein
MKILGILGVLGLLSFSSHLISCAELQTSAPEPNSQQTATSGASNRPAEQSQATANQEKPVEGNVVYRPGSGTIFVVELLNSLDAKKSRVGDQIECVVRQDLLFKGKVIVPREAKVMGHVTEAIEYTKEHSSRLGMLFEKVILKDKTELLFQQPAVIEAVAKPIQHVVIPTSRLDQMPVQMEKGKNTGAAAIDAMQSNPNILGANFPQTIGVISAANRGVVGLKGLTLEKSNPEAVTIVDGKGNVKLASRTQMVLRVIDRTK